MDCGAQIAVIIPAYNGAAYLAETLESVLAQTCPAAEIIVIDDGSPDNSAEIAEKFEGRLRLIRRNNAGVSATRNYGASLVNTEWIHFLDQDDVWEPDHLLRQIETILRCPQADAVYTGRRTLQEDFEGGTFSLTEPVKLPSTAEFPEHLVDRCPFTPSSVCLKTKTFLKAGGFDNRHNGVEDWDLFLRLRLQGAVFVHSPEPTVRYRVHAAANTNNPLPVLAKGIAVVKQNILPQMSPWQRATHGRRIVSRLEGEAAILLRQNHQPGALPLMLRSIVRHPFHEVRRYKIAAHMLLRGYPTARGGAKDGGKTK